MRQQQYPRTSTARLPLLIRPTCTVRLAVAGAGSGELPVDMAKDTPLDMSQFEYMFNASRRALPKSDKVGFCALFG